MRVRSKNKFCKCGCGRKRDKNGLLNKTCESRLYRLKEPVRNAYNCIKNSAKKRKKDFNLTFDWFVKFVKDNGYIQGKGLTGDSLTIDRIENDKGYIMGNLQVLTRSQNSAKYWDLDFDALAEKGIYSGDKINIPF